MTTQQSPLILNLFLRKTRSRKSREYRDVISGKLCFLNVFRPHENAKKAFSNSGLKSVYEKFRFHDGLVWTVSLTVEIKLRFHISLALCGRRVSLYFLFLELIDDTL